jgi:cytoskeletal protein CcmA (bactofilin family)
MRRHVLAGRGRADERGSTLIMVMAIITAVLLLGSALFILGIGESGLVEYATDTAAAFWLAEAGQERARAWLEEQAGMTPPVYPAEGSFENQPLAGGEYDASILRRPFSDPSIAEYDVVSYGEKDGDIREVRTVLRSESFANFVYFHNQSSDIWHVSGDSLDGPFHANGHIRIRGTPWFGGRVTTTADYLIVQDGSNPTFEMGYQVSVPEIPFPDPTLIPDAIRASAQSEGLYEGELHGNDARYEVVLGRNGNLGYLSYRSYEQGGGGGHGQGHGQGHGGGGYQYSPWTDVAVSSINGPVFLDSDVWIEGTLDGKVTIGSGATVHIRDDVLYEDATPRGGPFPGCDDMLGLIAAGDVIVDMTAPNMDDCVIHGHVMAMQHSLMAELYNQGPPRGDLVVWGGIAQENTGPVGAFNQYDIIEHGYTKDYHYDTRLRSGAAPPWYPLTGRYMIVSWEDVQPPEL